MRIMRFSWVKYGDSYCCHQISYNFALYRRVNNDILAKLGILENYKLKGLPKTWKKTEKKTLNFLVICNVGLL